jgi:hypothetical protein
MKLEDRVKELEDRVKELEERARQLELRPVAYPIYVPYPMPAPTWQPQPPTYVPFQPIWTTTCDALPLTN